MKCTPATGGAFHCRPGSDRQGSVVVPVAVVCRVAMTVVHVVHVVAVWYGHVPAGVTVLVIVT